MLVIGCLTIGFHHFQGSCNHTGKNRQFGCRSIVLLELGYARKRWLNMLYWIVWETKYGHFTMLNIPKCEHLTVLVCPLWFLVISAMRQLGNVQSFKTYMFLLLSFLPWTQPQLGRGCKRDQDEIRNYMDRGVTPPRQVYLHVNRPWGNLRAQ